jgi:hypothetical protein
MIRTVNYKSVCDYRQDGCDVCYFRGVKTVYLGIEWPVDP